MQLRSNIVTQQSLEWNPKGIHGIVPLNYCHQWEEQEK